MTTSTLAARRAAASASPDVAQLLSPFIGREPITPGEDTAPRRSIEIAATGAGNVVLKLADNSTTTIPVAVGLTILPYAVRTVVVAGTTAVASYGNLL